MDMFEGINDLACLDDHDVQRDALLELLLDAMFEEETVPFTFLVPEDMDVSFDVVDPDAFQEGMVDGYISRLNNAMAVPTYEVKIQAEYGDVIRVSHPDTIAPELDGPRFENMLQVDLTVVFHGRVAPNGHTLEASVSISPTEQVGVVMD